MDTSVAAKSGARFVPESVLGRRTFGVEAGGGVRGLAAGLRYVALSGGAVETASSFLPSRSAAGDEGHAVVLPDRLHGGFAFFGGHTVFRASTWLGEAAPALDSPTDVTRIDVGLDRLYIGSGSGSGSSALAAVDPLTFAPTSMGRLPDAPSSIGYAAFDGWHAAAIADLRGLVMTRDAGASWQTIAVPLVPSEVQASESGFVVFGRSAAGAEGALDVDLDGHVTPASSVAEAKARVPGALASTDAAQILATLASVGPFGARPLAAAIEDGWPLADGSALVLRSGRFARIGLERGDILETFPAAVAEGARCHPLGLGGDALGFVCGLENADTWLYTFDGARRSLRPFGHFSGPRAVLAPGNGRVAVHGSCDERAPHAADVYCLSASRLGEWRELRLEGALDGERVVPLGRGGIAVLSPAHGDLARMRLTVRGASGSGAPVSMPLRVHADEAPASAPVAAGVASLLKNGVWLDEVRETAPGVLAAWVDGHGSMLGLSITLDGDATHGDWVRDLANPFVSGRFGLGMSAARRGYQTVDGGQHWTALETPAPLVAPGTVEHRACGPVGCSALGWLRVGWGERRDAPPVPEDPRVPSLASAASLAHPRTATPSLSCRQVGAARRERATTTPKAPAFAMTGALVGTTKTAALEDWWPYFGLAAPRAAPGSHGASFEVRGALGREPAGRVYLWGSQAPVDDATLAALPPELAPHFAVRWTWPFGGAADARASAPGPAPATLATMIDPAAGAGAGGSLALLAGQGPDDALLVRGSGGTSDVFELVAGRPPLAWRAESLAGTPATPPGLPTILAAVEVSGHWYFASSSAPGEPGPARTFLWKVEHGVARRLATVPRYVGEGRRPELRLARRDDGRAIGLLVGNDPRQPGEADHAIWVLPLDLATGGLGEPESLGALDLTQDTALTPCAADTRLPGWVVDLELGSRPKLLAKPEPVVVSSAVARLHLSGATLSGTGSTSGPAGVCLERMGGALSELGQLAPMISTTSASGEVSPPFVLSVVSSTQRTSLLCQRLR